MKRDKIYIRSEMQMWAPCFEVCLNLYACHQFLIVNSISRGGHYFSYTPVLQGRTILKKGPEVQAGHQGAAVSAEEGAILSLAASASPAASATSAPTPASTKLKQFK